MFGTRNQNSFASNRAHTEIHDWLKGTAGLQGQYTSLFASVGLSIWALLVIPLTTGKGLTEALEKGDKT